MASVSAKIEVAGVSDDADLEVQQRQANKTTKSESSCHRQTFFWVAMTWQVVMLILYACFADYVHMSKATTGSKEVQAETDHFYPVYQDVHVMIFFGFGFLMTFLRKYGYSAVGYNFLLGAFTVQWYILVDGFMDSFWNDNEFRGECAPIGDTLVDHDGDPSRFCIELKIESLLEGDFAAAAVLITYGAVLGKTNPTQLIIVAIFEMFFYSFNAHIGMANFLAVDMGGSVFVHTFGAYFGLALSWVISSSKDGKTSVSGEVVDREGAASSSSSDMFSMLGTIFLWMFWPSFNGALAPDDQQYRVMINTVLSLAACCVAAFVVDNLVRSKHKFDMVSIQNATIAGGVAVGSAADLVIHPWGAILIGVVSGSISVLGFRFIQPALKQVGLDDTCGVHNLHGMPGILGGVSGTIAAALATDTIYGKSIGTVFPAMADGGRDGALQARYQIAALCVTLVIAIIGGLVTGIIIKIPCFAYAGKLKDGRKATRYPFCNFCHSTDENTWYDDSYYWQVPEVEAEVEAESF